MPIYEFFCVSCKKKFSRLCRISDRDKPQKCEFCGAQTNTRMVSRFKTVRNEEQLMESLADPSKLSGLDENDPGSMAEWAKKMAREMGENMDDEIDQMAEEEFSSADEESEEPSDSNEASDQL